jgi:hypothetical protein
MLWPLKPNLMGSAGLRIYIRMVPICAAPSGLENGRFIGHARDRCLYRRCRRSNCACSGLFTLGAKGTQMTPPAVVSQSYLTQRPCAPPPMWAHPEDVPMAPEGPAPDGPAPDRNESAG